MTKNIRTPVSQKNEEGKVPKRSSLLDRIGGFHLHFGRFSRDAAAILQIALALVILLGWIGVSSGTMLSRFVLLLNVWFGWGTLLIISVLLVAGISTLGRDKSHNFNWTQIFGLEIVFFLSLAILAQVQGSDLVLAEAGWGGRIGWGISEIASRIFGSVGGFLAILIVLLATIAWILGLWSKLEGWLLSQGGVTREAFHSQEAEPTRHVVALPPPETKLRTIRSKTGKLEPEFRKSFKVSEREEVRVAPLLRRESLPPLLILPGEQKVRADERQINQTAGMIEKTLSEFGIPAKVTGFRMGPTVTQFAVQPGFIRKGNEDDAQQLKVRVAQIAGLQKDLALALSADRLRIEAPVPGRDYVGIEVPNQRSSLVKLRPLLETDAITKLNSPLAIALGRDVSGQPIVADLARMPHLLIAGTTGSGKSVCIAAITACLTMNNSPEDLRLVMIDSKMVELIRFNGLPHLLGKVETQIPRILAVLQWVVVEMEHRYKLLEASKVRDIDAYNQKLSRRKDTQKLPRIVVLIDELADLMMSAPDQTEHNLVRLAQMARATGIHLVVATQRPSTDVVTGLIKANFPARLAFAVASGVDSRVILDLPGAETLLGKGDLLFLNPEVGNPVRAQGVIVTDQEIERIIAFWQKEHPGDSNLPPWESILEDTGNKNGDDVLVEKAIIMLKREQRASASMLQRRLNIGFPRAARLLDQLEEMGIVGPAVGGGRDRDILIEPDQEEEE